MFQTSDDFTIPPARPIAYVVERARRGQGRRRGAGVARPKGADQLPFGSRRRSATPSTSASTRSLARLLLQVDVDCSQARGAGVDPEDPPLRWEVSASRPRPAGARPRCSPTRPAASTTAAARRAAAAGPPRADARRRAARVLAALPPRRRTRSGARRAGFTHPPEIYAITAAPIGALIPAAHSARAPGASCSARATARRASASSCATRPCSSRRRPRTLEVLDADDGEWQTWEQRRVVRRERPRRPPLRARRRRRHDRARPRGPLARRRLAAVRRDPAEGRAAAHDRATATAAAAAATSRPAALTRAEDGDPRRGLGHQPDGAAGGVDPESLESTRAGARDGDPHALPRRHGARTSSSSAARPRRASRARSACRRDGGRHPGAHRARHRAGRPAARRARADPGRRRCCARSRRTSTSGA